MYKKVLLALTLVLTGCADSAASDYEINAVLKDSTVIWPPNEEHGNITVKGLFKEQLEIEKIKEGDWYRYLYKVTYDSLEVISGTWEDPEISFLCKDSWPTEESGIMMKKLAWPFREKEYKIFEISKVESKNLITGYRKIKTPR